MHDILYQVWGSYAMCMGAGLAHMHFRCHKHLAHVLPMGGPAIFYYLGREIERWQHGEEPHTAWELFELLVTPISITVSFLLFVFFLRLRLSREQQSAEQLVVIEAGHAVGDGVQRGVVVEGQVLAPEATAPVGVGGMGAVDDG